MALGVETIGNFNVRKMGDGRYSVTTNIPGNCAACIMDEEGVRKMREKYNRPADTFETTPKTTDNWLVQYLNGRGERAKMMIFYPVSYADQFGGPMQQFKKLGDDLQNVFG